MPRITVGSENDAAIEIHYEDHGSGRPIVLIHGYPLEDTDKLAPDRISDQALHASFNVAVGSSPYATYACVDTWLTDFRGDLPKIDVPTLVVHGTEDRILPFEATAARLPGLIADVEVVTVEGGPHNIGWTHPDEVNRAMLDFVAD
jgi:non-heme chloroperoxidase